MNMKYLAILFGACLGLAGCVIETGSGGSGGTGGGNGGSGAEGGGGSGVGGGTTTDTAQGGGGAGGGGDCVSCAEVITDSSLDPCEGTSTDLYNALAECICGTDFMGLDAKCYEACGANLCAGEAQDGDCTTCVLDTNAGCGVQFNECSNDAG